MGRIFLSSLLVLVLAGLGAGAVSANDFKGVISLSEVADNGMEQAVAFADINNDANMDIYVSNKEGANKLYLSNGDGTFEDITDTAGPGVDHPGFTMGSVFGDFDNDGLVDLYLATGGEYENEANRLFKNMGNNTFVDVSEKAGVALKQFTNSVSTVDYDNDGFLDIYCANYGPGAKNVLYRNNGDGTFTDTTDVAGVGDSPWSWMGVWADVNNDNLPDLYVVNGRYPSGVPDKLYLNNGRGAFSECAEKAAIDDLSQGVGASFVDIDHNGTLDLIVANDVGRNNLYLNQGDGTFAKATERIKSGH